MREVLPLLASGDVEGSLLAETRSHVARCEACREAVFEYGAQGMLLRASVPPESSESLWGALKERIKPRSEDWSDFGGEA